MKNILHPYVGRSELMNWFWPYPRGKFKNIDFPNVFSIFIKNNLRGPKMGGWPNLLSPLYLNASREKDRQKCLRQIFLGKNWEENGSNTHNILRVVGLEIAVVLIVCFWSVFALALSILIDSICFFYQLTWFRIFESIFVFKQK